MTQSTIKFGTDGWRAVMCEDFTVDKVKLVSQAIANYLNERWQRDVSIFIGYDTRFLSDYFAQACAAVLAGNGIKVLMANRPMPTPLTAYAIRDFDANGALMVTASHNPYQYNGIKFIPEYAGPATTEITEAIEEKLAKVTESDVKEANVKKTKLIEHVDPLPGYQKQLEKLIQTKLLAQKKLKVVVDPMFGAASGVIEQLLLGFGCETKSVSSDIKNPYFGGILPDPSKLENLEFLAKAMEQDRADIGLALDGDGDRFGAIDSLGKFIMANQILALITHYLIKERDFRGKVVRSVATTHFLDAITEKNNLELVETPVGFKFVGQEMRKNPVVLGGEESAGLSILGHIPEKDGVLAILLLAEITAFYGKPLSEILEDLWKTYGKFTSARLDIHLSDEGKRRLMESFSFDLKEITGLKVLETVNIDGKKFILEGGSWLLARPSGTEPLVRIYFESTSTEDFNNLKAYAEKLADEFS